MPNATVRATARTLPEHVRRTFRGSAQLPKATRRRLDDAVERIILARDTMDALDEDLEDGHDLEDDPAELGIADDDALIEQLAGEPSLGAHVRRRSAFRRSGSP